MAGLQGRLQTLAPQHGASLAALMAELNGLIYASTDGDKYATLFYSVYDDATRTLNYVNAGHNPPLIVRTNGTLERLEPTGMVIGLMPEAEFTQAARQLGLGDTLVLFTDGVTEAVNVDGEPFGDARLEQLVTSGRASHPAELESQIMQAVDRFTGSGQQHDDITVVVAQVRSPDAHGDASHDPSVAR